MKSSDIIKNIVNSVAPESKPLKIIRGQGVKEFLDNVTINTTLILPEVPKRHEHNFPYKFDSIEMIFENEVYAIFLALKRNKRLFIKLFQEPGYIVYPPYNVTDPFNKKRKEFNFPDNASILEGAFYDTDFIWTWKNNRYL